MIEILVCTLIKQKKVVLRHAGRMCKMLPGPTTKKHVEIVNCCNYLGINLNFNVTQKTISMQGWKCMFGILKV